MQQICNLCKTVLTKKMSNKYKTVFTCRKQNCANFGKDVLVKKW